MDFQEMMRRACINNSELTTNTDNEVIPIENKNDKNESLIVKEPFNLEKSKEEMNLLGNRLNEVFKVISKIEENIKQLKNYYRVKNTSSTIHPFLINGGNKEAYYKNGFIYVHTGSSEEVFKFMDLEEHNINIFFKNNDKLIFTIRSNFFEVIKEEDYNNLQLLGKEIDNLLQEKRHLSSKLSTIEENISNYIFWKQYDIPFKFVVDIKPVLSGLKANSWGDGSNKATVYHIILKEELHNGKLKRGINDFLCSQPQGRHYYTHSSTLEDEIQNRVTCKQCLKQLEKYKIED